MTTNNLPGYGTSNKLRRGSWWTRKYHHKKAVIKSLGDNQYSLKIPISREEAKSIPLEQHQYIRLKFRNRTLFFSIKNKQLSKSEFDREPNVESKLIINNQNIITNSTVGNITNITNINNSNPVILGPLITFGPDGICIGCETYGLVEYTIVFTGTIPILSSNDPFMIEGADFFFI